MKEEWVLSIRQQCKAMGVAFFLKQWVGVRKKVAGRTLRGRTQDDLPKRVVNPTLPSLPRVPHALAMGTGMRVQLER